MADESHAAIVSPGGQIDRTRPLALPLRRPRVSTGYAGRHAGLGAARQRRAAGRAQLQVSPAARHLSRRLGGAERAGAAAQAARAREPNTRATMVELLRRAGARRARTAGRRSRFDVGAVNGCSRRSSPAGFYYKTFMWPRARSGSGLRAAASAAPPASGARADEPDPDRYEKTPRPLRRAGGRRRPGRAVGGARRGREPGARVILADEDAELGGSLLRERDGVGDAPAPNGLRATPTELAAMPEVRLLPRTTAFGYYDGGTCRRARARRDHLGRRRRRTRRGSASG